MSLILRFLVCLFLSLILAACGGSISENDDAPNTDPVAVDNTEDTSMNTPVTIAVLSNDSDPDGDSLTITDVSLPSNGMADINGTSIIYTPDNGFTGSDAFNYTISDGNGGTATADVTVSVAQNLVVANDDSGDAFRFVGQEEQIIPYDAIFQNDLNTDSNSTLTNAESNNSAIVVFDNDEREITYTPAFGYQGPALFNYTVSNGTSSDSATVNVVIVQDYELTLTVRDGGAITSRHAANEIIPIEADQDNGQTFAVWQADLDLFNDASTDPLDPTTSIIMPNRDTEVEAIYTNIMSDNEAPSAPVGLQSTDILNDRVALQWQASSDNVHVWKYRITITGGSIVDDNTEVSGRYQSITINNLEPNTTYTFSAIAIDPSGNTSPAATIQVTTETIIQNAERVYIWGHSLHNHILSPTDTDDRYFASPVWLEEMYRAANGNFLVDGQFYDFDSHTNLSFNWAWENTLGTIFSACPDCRYTSSQEGRAEDFRTIGQYNLVMYTPLNFVWWDNPNQDVVANEAADFLEVVDFVEANAEEATIYFFMPWAPTRSIFTDFDFQNPATYPDTTMEDAYYDYGESDAYIQNFRDVFNTAVSQRPSSNILFMPVNTLLMQTLRDSVILEDLIFADLFEDGAPHGTPVAYFLSAIIQYVIINDTAPPSPSTTEMQTAGIPQVIIDNFDTVASNILQRWNDYQN